jgi:hypothetical protein
MNFEKGPFRVFIKIDFATFFSSTHIDRYFMSNKGSDYLYSIVMN